MKSKGGSAFYFVAIMDESKLLTEHRKKHFLRPRFIDFGAIRNRYQGGLRLAVRRIIQQVNLNSKDLVKYDQLKFMGIMEVSPSLTRDLHEDLKGATLGIHLHLFFRNLASITNADLYSKLQKTQFGNDVLKFEELREESYIYHQKRFLNYHIKHSDLIPAKDTILCSKPLEKYFKQERLDFA